MRIRHDARVGAALRFRDDDTGDGSGDSHTKDYKPAIILGALGGAVCIIGLCLIVYRRWRRSRTAKYSRSGRDDNDHAETADGPATSETPAAGSRTRLGHQGSVSTVGRNTSVRSVMTLPPYRPKPLENESVLGREGERDGIDVVVEMPTIEDEETLRENEMEALFQIRVARHRQIEEREARRVARREARARNDQAALRAIREQAQAATASNAQEIESLREDHNRAKETRARAVSSVSYADLGVARHDGTRIRANSSESERVGLLSDAATIGSGAASARSPSALSQTFSRPSMHERGRSGSSVLSIATARSSGEQQLQPTTTARSRTSSTGPRDRAGSSPELIDASEAAGLAASGDEDGVPAHSPPGYDEVSLDDLTPAQSRAASPYAEPPPDYDGASASAPASGGAAAGPTEARNRRVSAHLADLAAAASAADASSSSSSSTGTGPVQPRDGEQRRLSRNSGILPQLPSLRLGQLPQIVIEPSSAVSREPGQP